MLQILTVRKRNSLNQAMLQVRNLRECSLNQVESQVAKMAKRDSLNQRSCANSPYRENAPTSTYPWMPGLSHQGQGANTLQTLALVKVQGCKQGDTSKSGHF